MTGIYRDQFASLGEFLTAVVIADTDGPRDHRLEMQAAATGNNATFPSEGGFLVPEQFATEVWDRVDDVGRLIGRATRQPITTRAGVLDLPAVDETSRANGSRFGGVALKWLEEDGETLPTSRPKFGRLRLTPTRLGGVVYVTNELLSDAGAFASWFIRMAAAEVAFAVEDTMVGGSGVGRPLGVLRSDAIIEVAAEGGQTAGTVTPTNLLDMAARLWGASHASAVWLLGMPAWRQIVGASFSNGAPCVVFGPGGPTCLGMPVMQCEYTEPLGARGDVVLGDFTQYVVSERENAVVGSLHVRFLQNEGALKIRARIDGQPGWKSPVTPKNSATTESPFVTLAARP